MRDITLPLSKRVPDGLHGSWEDVFHQTGTKRFYSPCGTMPRCARWPAGQFDAMLHIDETSALEPLDKGPVWSTGEAPETFASGI